MEDLKITLKLRKLLDKYDNDPSCLCTIICNTYSILINNPMFLKNNPILMRAMYEKIQDYIEYLNKYNINTQKITSLLYKYANLVEFILNENA